MTAAAEQPIGRSGRLGLLWAVPVLCFLAIGACWVLSTPPGAGVDEYSHYVRVVGIAHGSLIGDDAPADLAVPPLEGAHLRRVLHEAGMFAIPGNTPGPSQACNTADTTVPFACPEPATHTGDHVEVSLHGRYLPASYFLPALLSRAGTNTWRTLVLARLGFLLQNAFLLAISVLAVRRAAPRLSSAALGGLLLCATPLVLFQAGTLAPNGTEILAVVTFLATFLAAVRGRSRRWLWIAAGVGVFACWTRDLGAADVALFAVLATALVPGAGAWLWSRRRTTDVIAAIVLAVAALGATAWQVVLKSSLDLGVGSPGILWADLGRTIGMLRDSIGLLGWLNVPIDPVVEALWIAGWITAVAVLVRRADRRARIVAGVLAVAYVAGNLVLLEALRRAGFGAQARFTIALPIAAVVVLCVAQPAGPGVRRRTGLLAQWPLAVASVIAALGHLSGLLLTAQHNAVGLGRPMSFTDAAWSPPGGWPLMLTAYAISCGSLLVLAPLAGRNRVTPAVGP